MNFKTQFLPCEIVKVQLWVRKLGFLDITSECQNQRAEQAEYKIYYIVNPLKLYLMWLSVNVIDFSRLPPPHPYLGGLCEECVQIPSTLPIHKIFEVFL